MGPGLGFGIARDELIRDFGAQATVRGERYAAEGRVRDVEFDDERVLRGRCVGSDGHVYVLEVGLSQGHRVIVEWALCSCPVGSFCKHAVALVLTAAPGSSLQPPVERWRYLLDRVLDEVALPENGGKPIALEFSIGAPTRYRPGTLLTLRPLTLGKRGTWITRALTWRRLIDHPQAAEFDPGQYRAVRALVSEMERHYPSHGSEGMVLNGMPATLWPRLEEVLDAGVTVLADAASGIRAVELIKNVHLRLDFAAGDAGGAVMSVALIVDGQESEPDGVGLIGMPAPHGMFQVVDSVLRLGAFDPVPGRTMAELLGHHEKVHIPADMARELAVDILPRLASSVDMEVADGLFVPPTITGPVPVLTVKIVDGGARAFWSTRYQVNDQHHDFDPMAQVGLIGYRDPAAEEALWQRVTPALQAVAAAAQDWKRQAAQHVNRRISATLDADAVHELRAIVNATSAVDAVAVASRRTLLGGASLTQVEAAVLCDQTLPQLDCFADLTVDSDERYRAAGADPLLSFSGDTSLPGDWFSLNVTVSVDGETVALPEVIRELTAGATHMLLPSGLYFRLDTPELIRLRALLDEARALGEIDGDRANAASMNMTLWDELLELGVVDEQLARWRANLAQLTAARPPVPIEPPTGLDAELRDYQREGLDWLSFLWDNGIGGVLADDMGLGKTVQTLALIARAVAGGAGKFLVVAPTSVTLNWVAECLKFTPGLTAVVVTSTDARAAVGLAEQVAEADIVVTSYTLLRMDVAAYSQIQWAGMVLDEAQFVKNHHSKTHQSARMLDVPFKLAITGTPMENNLMELWSLLSITVPGLFPSPKVFDTYFRKPIESGEADDRLPVLRRRIKPVLLRRTKGQVVTELPPKSEQVLTIGLSTKHRKIYDTRLARERQKVLGLLGDWEKNRFQIFRSLTLLRQLSLHPGLVDDSARSVGSAKIDFLVEQLEQLVAEGHSALVFSQFTGFLGIVRAHLDSAGIAYSYLDGSVDSDGRATAIEEFGAGTKQVFLISLKAGGFGLNLTAADYCFLCDPWWSPAAEAQAVDRAHRIGQTRPVSVYRLVAENTIEEKVVALQERKRALFAAVVDDGDLFGSAITASDIRELLG
ncbi:MULTISPECIES: DEAD/DEAH box helicase [unclassified Mycolicibacterium]|uniref:DEAD/DEAH box helicase n=1 Tax=unclassified Mycolicibacterium TaxID=2636767 RepID=UPI0012DCFBF9|nr:MULTISPECIES: DEAD/DEAH box helicase [unclassified Mycolicibacterium]MUL80415.1 DEAD/DEAH box helicase [Mycolicibacterium sp. CBMA 329]MUL86182.1 DEAD/DEAH box helicase [Mycolicibacterium sp. CBMA 331]MUM01155.1 DEAD/DEAH box helicase [Mycolicibacterium sp. CBMA 334]MUM26281.1 DEAD/DEAH box helicase [Mycolicibacterium sp. CBMA 295]MUM36478.1 DEAD/DEAH box helicase [Mycolicibacterium sp. CBMA 247]